MPQRKTSRRKRDPWQALRRPRELDIRERIGHLPTATSDPPQVIDELRAAYDETENPVHVWDAIAHVQVHSELRGENLPLPAWVLAYLYRVAGEIMGRVVAHEDGERKEPRPRDELSQLAANQRLEAALEALGFTSPNRPNVFQGYRKREKVREIVKTAEKRKAEGERLSKIASDLLPHADNPEKALRRRMKKVRDKK